MTPSELQRCMKEAVNVGVANAQHKVKYDLSADSKQKLENAARELGGWKKAATRIHVHYNMLDNPGEAIMEGDQIRSGIATLMIFLVIGCRAHGYIVKL